MNQTISHLYDVIFDSLLLHLDVFITKPQTENQHKKQENIFLTKQKLLPNILRQIVSHFKPYIFLLLTVSFYSMSKYSVCCSITRYCKYCKSWHTQSLNI